MNTAGGVELPIEAFPGRFSLFLKHGAECCSVSARIAVVFLLGVDSNTSVDVDSDPP